MDLKNRDVLVLGGAGLVGMAVARRIVEYDPRTLVLASLKQEEADAAAQTLRSELPADSAIDVQGAWGDLFVPHAFKDRGRGAVMADPQACTSLVDDLYSEWTPEVLERSALGVLLAETKPAVIVDCINTATALAYQNSFASAAELRDTASQGVVGLHDVERHLATLYLPQLIRHAQIALEGMKRAGTEIYVKVGTAGTGGMGLNIPFTHSEERPSRVLLAKSGVAGAQTLLLYLMARTPGAPAVKEVKPTAAISWKAIGYGPVTRGGVPIQRYDAVRPLSRQEAFGEEAEQGYEPVEEPLEGVFLDAGENGLFSMGEFEALTALGLMEFVTPEEIAQNVIREITAHPTGKDVIAALDAATLGPTYRAGVLRSSALEHMDELEGRKGVQAIAYEMLGPPRLSKLLFESAILQRLFDKISAARELDPAKTAARAEELVTGDADFRQRIVSIGIPILLSDGERILRGPQLKAPALGDGPLEERSLDRGWVDLREANWRRWKSRLAEFSAEVDARPGPEAGSRGDHEYGDERGIVRPGRLAAWIFRNEDQGERIKR